MRMLSDIINESENHFIYLKKNEVVHVEEDGFEITRPVVIDGCGATITGNGGNQILISASEVTFKNVTFRDFFDVFRIDAKGKEIYNISIEGCTFEDYKKDAILVASTKSESHIKDLLITDCFFNGPDGFWESDDKCFGMYGVMLQVARAEDKNEIENCSVDGVTIQRCRSQGDNRCAVWISGATSTDMPDGLKKNEYGHTGNLIMKNIIIADNDFHGSYDATINVITAMGNQDDTYIETLIIKNNIVEQGIWGIFVIAGEPLISSASNIHIKDVVIENNQITLREGGPGEASYGIAVMGGRLDYFSESSVKNCTMENVRIRGNIIKDVTTGMIVTGSDSLVDGIGCELTNCIVQNVQISDNHISNVEYAFKFFGTWMEGRAYDYKIGIPPKDVIWTEFVEDNKTMTAISKDNSVKDISCKDNIVIGYKYQYVIAGAFASGHCLVKNNEVKNITVQNNTFKQGEKRINIQNAILSDWVKDEGNHIDEGIKWQI